MLGLNTDRAKVLLGRKAFILGSGIPYSLSKSGAGNRKKRVPDSLWLEVVQRPVVRD